jgi:hypothetical protein
MADTCFGREWWEADEKRSEKPSRQNQTDRLATGTTAIGAMCASASAQRALQLSAAKQYEFCGMELGTWVFTT